MALTVIKITDKDGTEKDVVVDDLLGGLPPELMQLVRAWRHKGAKHVTKVSVSNASTDILAANSSRISAIIYNNGGATTYLSQTTATTNDFPLAAGGALVDDDSDDAWKGITASGTADLRVIEVY